MTEIASQVDISKALAIGGWMSEKELTWLAIQASKCNKIVEFGCFHGRSTRALADNSSKNAIIWAVDIWGSDYFMENGEKVEIDTCCMPIFKDNLKDHIKAGKIIPVRQFSSNFFLHEKVDMVFIDADHRFNSVYSDITRAMNLLKPNGLLCGHDYDHPQWPGVSQAVDYLIGDIEVEEMIWWTRKF